MTSFRQLTEDILVMENALAGSSHRERLRLVSTGDKVRILCTEHGNADDLEVAMLYRQGWPRGWGHCRYCEGEAFDVAALTKSSRSHASTPKSRREALR